MMATLSRRPSRRRQRQENLEQQQLCQQHQQQQQQQSQSLFSQQSINGDNIVNAASTLPLPPSQKGSKKSSFFNIRNKFIKSKCKQKQKQQNKSCSKKPNVLLCDKTAIKICMLLKRSKWKPLAKLIDSLISSCNDIDSNCSSNANANLKAWVSDHKDKNSKKDPASIDCCDGNHQIETEDANVDTTNNKNNTGAQQRQNNEQHCYDIFKSIRNHQHDHSGILHHLLRNFAPSEIILDLIHQFPYLVYDIDDYGISPLHIAAAHGLPPLFSKALLKCYPESALLQDRFGRTPLIAACQSQSSGMDPEIPYTPSGVQYSVDFWIHHQIVVLLLSVPLNGITMEDSCGYNAIEYTIMGHGPMSVVQVLQSKLAIERHVLSELKNTKKRTKLPVFPVEPLYYFCDGDGTGFGHGQDAEDEAVYEDNNGNGYGYGYGYGGKKNAKIIHRTHSQDHKYTYSSGRQISNHECEFEKGWRPIMMTYRESDFHNPKRIQIHSRLQSMELECDGLSQEQHNCMRYRKGLRAFLGRKIVMIR